MKAFKIGAVASLVLALFAGSAIAQNAAPEAPPVASSWLPEGKISGGVSVTNSSSATALPTGGDQIWVCNTGATNDAYIGFGGSAVSAATTLSSWLKAGTCWTYNRRLATGNLAGYIAALTSSSTTTLTVETGIGTGPSQQTSSGGGSSGAVYGPTAAGTAAANPPIIIGGTVDGSSTGAVDNWKVLAGIGYINCANCSGSGVSTTDPSTYTYTSSLFAGGGGFYQTTATANPLTTGQQGMFQVTAQRALFTNLRNASGVEIGTTTTPVQVSLANTGANSTSLLVNVASGGIASGAVASGAYASGAFAAGAGVDGWDVTEGTKADTAWSSGSGSIVSILKNIATTAASPIPACAASPCTTVIGDVVLYQGTTALSSSNPLFAQLTAGSAIFGNVRIDQTTVGTTNGVSLAQIGATTVVTGGVAGSLGIGGQAANNATTAGYPVQMSALAESAEPTLATNGQNASLATDLAHKLIISPYANKENLWFGTSVATASTAAKTIIAASGSLKTYVTAIQCGRTDAGTTASYVTFSDTASSILVLPNNGGGGGNNITFTTPMNAGNAAFTFTSSASLSSVYCNAQGYYGT